MKKLNRIVAMFLCTVLLGIGFCVKPVSVKAAGNSYYYYEAYSKSGGRITGGTRYSVNAGLQAIWETGGAYKGTVTGSNDGSCHGVTLYYQYSPVYINFDAGGYVAQEYKNNNTEYVKGIQQALKDMGFYSDSIDGSFGPNTYNAVVAFQKRYCSQVDGSVGPETYRMLATR